ncbi:hypothetical protein IV203_007105 [Nitzschia inconspicua]|uniref:Uncharacterized protein n=1 Tax=Nitzschia inconspicua TaxID=303405 RepID=A0A9K3PC34_9STRA|nr:hypothetical protein IV203_007105 [Nitzschia inconspicua]
MSLLLMVLVLLDHSILTTSLLPAGLTHKSSSFGTATNPSAWNTRITTTVLLMARKEIKSDEDLKQELLEYLQTRKEANADQAAQEAKGKVVGGTRGNPFLEYVSAAPVKEQIIEQAPNVFDYDELTKYGFSHVVTPIMKLKGGRRAVYDLMGMDPPPLLGPPPKKSAPELKIDRTGAEDKARYSGLKMGQILNDVAMAEALEKANKKAKEGKQLRPKLMEEEYVRPFSEKRNTGPRQTPDWTPERLDEYAKMQGRAQSWARRAKLGEFVKDPFESLDSPIEFRLYAVLTAWFVAFSFGRATPAFLRDVVGSWSDPDIHSLTDTLQVPALALALASMGSSIICGALLAPEKNRSVLVWAVKGFFGGPLAVRQLRELDELITLEDQQKKDAEAKR